MNYQRSPAAFVIAALIFILGGLSPDAIADDDSAPANPSEMPSAFFDTLADVLTGTWVGQWTNGTFEDPAEWHAVQIEYRLTANGTALVEDYIYPEGLGMTTVYHKDNNDLRLTHYCGAGNHPDMIARDFDMQARTVRFDFTGITNHASPDSYHSRKLELEIVDNDHVKIIYYGRHGEGHWRPQAYVLTRSAALSN